MPPVVKYRLLIKYLKSEGFFCVRTKGSHERWIHENGIECTIPKHKELAYGTFVAICEQMGTSAKIILEKLR